MLDLLSVTSSDQLAFFMEVDTDSSGQIDFADFLELMHMVGNKYSNNLPGPDPALTKSFSQDKESTIKNRGKSLKSDIDIESFGVSNASDFIAEAHHDINSDEPVQLTTTFERAENDSNEGHDDGDQVSVWKWESSVCTELADADSDKQSRAVLKATKSTPERFSKKKVYIEFSGALNLVTESNEIEIKSDMEQI
jgi:hypothetical protein